jgi:hypothetical protein
VKKAELKAIQKACRKALKANMPRKVFEGQEKTWCEDGRRLSLRIIETPPTTRTIKVADYKDEIQTYTLAFPYMQFYVLANNNPFVSWTKTPLEHSEQPVYPPLLPNVYKLCGVCLGDDFPYPRKPVELCESFWNSEFDPDEDDWFYKRVLKHTPLKSFGVWQEKSRRARHPLNLFKRWPFENPVIYRHITGL